MVNIVRSEFDSALRKWQAVVRHDMGSWAAEFCENYRPALLKAYKKKIPIDALLDMIGLLKRREIAGTRQAAESKELRQHLIHAKEKMAPIMRDLARELRQRPAVLTYLGFPLADHLAYAASELEKLFPKHPGQPGKFVSTGRYVLLATFFRHHTGKPEWALVTEICGAFESDSPDDSGKRVRQLPSVERDWSGALVKGTRVPPTHRIPKEDRRAWLRLLFEEIVEKDMLDQEAAALRIQRKKRD
jgi:hypothetical protein